MAPDIKYTKIFINNEWVDSKSGKTFDTYNPHDGSVIAKVAEGDQADIDAAVAAAKAAFHRNSEWRLLDASQRGRILNKFADLIEHHHEYLARLETHNNGMVLNTSRYMTKNKAPSMVRYLASLADKIQGDTIPVDGDMFSYTLKQPVGVCGLILPWNGPIVMFLHKVCTALAAGCTAVVKPAEQTPLSALYLASLLVEAGLPKGVLNVVPGYGETAGAALTHHPDVAKLSFTGSVEIFGPVQSIFKFNTLEEAIDRANNTSYGLAAGIFTTNMNNALQFSKHVEAGIVWVNTYMQLGEHLPFGGIKDSGLGRENGLHCVDAYLEVKTIAIALPKKV